MNRGKFRVTKRQYGERKKKQVKRERSAEEGIRRRKKRAEKNGE